METSKILKYKNQPLLTFDESLKQLSDLAEVGNALRELCNTCNYTPGQQVSKDEQIAFNNIRENYNQIIQLRKKMIRIKTTSISADEKLSLRKKATTYIEYFNIKLNTAQSVLSAKNILVDRLLKTITETSQTEINKLLQHLPILKEAVQKATKDSLKTLANNTSEAISFNRDSIDPTKLKTSEPQFSTVANNIFYATRYFIEKYLKKANYDNSFIRLIELKSIEITHILNGYQIRDKNDYASRLKTLAIFLSKLSNSKLQTQLRQILNIATNQNKTPELRVILTKFNLLSLSSLPKLNGSYPKATKETSETLH